MSDWSSSRRTEICFQKERTTHKNNKREKQRKRGGKEDDYVLSYSPPTVSLMRCAAATSSFNLEL